MKRFLILSAAIVLASSLTGCVTVRKVVRDRVDQEVAGNQGYLMGASEESYRQKPTEREYLDIRIEVPTWEEITAPAVRYQEEGEKPAKKPDYTKQPAGNKGYLSGRKKTDDIKPYAQKKAQYPETKTAYEYDDYEIDFIDYDGNAFAYEDVVLSPAYQEYTVKQGETLSHIAKAFYGKASKWTVIYEANSDTIKDPSKVRAGTKIKIPDLEETESRYIK
jgi:phage tail protein X